MLLTISFFFALAGVGFAGAAALMSDTGIDGTPGAFLAFAGAIAVIILLGVHLSGWVSTKMRRVVVGVAGLAAMLTALAAWFLMQNGLLAAMILSLLALLLSAVITGRKKTI